MTPFAFYRVGRSSYSVLERASGLEVAVVRGKREARKLREALLRSGASNLAEIVAAVRVAAEDLSTVRQRYGATR